MSGFTTSITTEPLSTVIERAGMNNVCFAINYIPAFRQIYVEFHGSDAVSLVEVDIKDLEGLAEMFSKSVPMITERMKYE